MCFILELILYVLKCLSISCDYFVCNYRGIGCINLFIIYFLNSVWKIDKIICLVVVIFKGEYNGI